MVRALKIGAGQNELSTGKPADHAKTNKQPLRFTTKAPPGW
ncbi:uncharacterized protein METZ01_LOCUS168549 [marine metagenome]|uniref:Uncharacterized protein n=1 Tax=marine metagenome TaxID=408172 RepID=A0A382BPK0_9ZZZZ